MLGALAFFLLLLAFYAFAFGATRLLLRRSCWDHYSLEAPWLTGPALMVLLVSVLGYREPFELPAWQAWAILTAGWVVSAIVAVVDRVALAVLLRQNGRRAIAIVLPACLASGVMLWFFEGKPWDNIAVPWIIEYINYGELAAVLTGHHHGLAGSAVNEFCATHHLVRYGQDIVVACVAQVAGLHPMQAVLPLAMLFRFQNTIALGLFLFAMNPGEKFRLWVVLVLVLDALLVSEMLLFGSSFFSSNCTSPLYAIYLVWLACQQDFRLREWIILVLMNLFFLVTYPEFLVVAKCFEALAVVLALWRKNKLTWLPLVASNVALFAMHPQAIMAKVAVLGRHMSGNDGWNVIGDPVLDPMHFFSNLIGLRYGILGYDPLHGLHALPWLVVALVWCQIVLGLILLGRRYRTAIILLAWLAMVVALHARSALNGSNFYAGFKLLSHTYFVVILAAATPLFVQSTFRRRLAVAVVALWLPVAALACYRVIPCLHGEGYHVRYSHLRHALRPFGDGQKVAVLCVTREPLLLVNLIGGESKLSIVALTAEQQAALQLHALDRWIDGTRRQPDGCQFDGIIVTEPAVLETGYCLVGKQSLKLETRRIVSRADGLVVCEGSIHIANAIVLPPFHWICEGSSRGPYMVATATRLRLGGEVGDYHPLPYRFTCHLDEFGWSQEVVVDKRGPFEIVLDLPEAAVGQSIGVEFRDYGTFRPVDSMTGSPDVRKLGFMLRSMAFAKAQP